jgi:DNA recombination protein RmuC
LIASPINLLALLRAVAYGWQQHAIADNARKIAAEARELYGRMERFVGHFSDVGKQLGKVINVYNKAVGSYDKRLVPAARRFYELGISETEMVEPESIELYPTAPSAAVESESEETSRV